MDYFFSNARFWLSDEDFKLHRDRVVLELFLNYNNDLKLNYQVFIQNLDAYKLEFPIEVPPMSGEQGFLLAALLDQIVESIWKAHGTAMADFQGRAFPDWPLTPTFYDDDPFRLEDESIDDLEYPDEIPF